MSTSHTKRFTGVIADDEDLGRVLLAEAVKECGLEAHAFNNGSDALTAALAGNVSIVLLDVEMPGMNGYDVCRRLRAEPRLASLPIVMVTGHEDSQAIQLAFEAGATDFVSKPVNWALLPRRLEYILRNAATAEHIERLAYTDTLTGLPNRQRCMELAERHFAEAVAQGQRVGVLYIDLNSFKRVNDTFGHSVGDFVLQTVAGKLAGALGQCAGSTDVMTLSRFGGDEFVVLIRSAHVHDLGQRAAEQCCAALREPIAYNGLEFYSVPSIGLALFPDHGGDVSTVLKHADTAMYHAKSGSSGSIAVYTSAMSSRIRDWLDLEARLRRAVTENLLQLQFQPKFSLLTNEMAGVEALVRWCDSEHGDVSPMRFVEIAEDSGLIIDIGSWVIRAACRQLRIWMDRGYAIPIAVNVSAKELLHGDPAGILSAAAAAAAQGVPTALIEIEITESLLAKDSSTVRDALERLRRLGCRIALDDFGTGYSSLAYITRFPPDRIKIDKAFITNVDSSPSDAAIANAILSLGESLNLIVTAEGVERTSQLEWLRTRGCHEVQGYLLSRPLNATDLERRFLNPRPTAAKVASA